ncbi:mannosyltransferase [Trapelia coarctata]|nr:mannosyltransferase [Trapelia coarctata]
MSDISPVFVLVALVLLIFSTALLILIVYFLPSSYNEKDESSAGPSRYQILVLGDIGRSPRMQYHAISMGKYGGPVDLIGYLDSDLHPDIFTHPSIAVHPIPKTPAFLKTDSHLLFLLFGPLKVIHQICALWLVLGYRTKPAKGLLVQNPPSIPPLLLAILTSYLRSTRLTIDWHNLGSTILALRLSPTHPLVRLSHLHDRLLGPLAHSHLTVSAAMSRTLSSSFNIPAARIHTLHDRPSKTFRPLTRDQRSTFLARCPETSAYATGIEKKRLRLLISSTSWTPDEDFSLLLDALVGYSTLATSSHPHLPELLLIITGKGPQKDHYLSLIASLEDADKLEMVTLKTAWLSMKDYASLLGAADLGISLHKSSSGIDLPMKVVDMFGAGLPVVGWSAFEAWPELVKEGVNGRGFGSVEELRDILVELLGEDSEGLERLRRGALKESERGWEGEWDSVAAKVLGFV